MYRISEEEEFSFAYHPISSNVAPEIGYLIKEDKTLRKIFHIGSNKTSKERPTIILHIVFEDQYQMYEESTSPFGSRKKSMNHKKGKNSDLEFLNGTMSPEHTYEYFLDRAGSYITPKANIAPVINENQSINENSLYMTRQTTEAKTSIFSQTKKSGSSKCSLFAKSI